MPLFRRSRKAFTLIEVIVVFLVIAILAAIAAVAYTSVVSNSKTRAAELTLSQFSTEAQALAVQSGGQAFTLDDLNAAVDDLNGTSAAGAPGAAAGQVEAAATTWVVKTGTSDYSDTATTVVGQLAGDPVGSELALSVLVPGHGCAYSTATLAGAPHTWSKSGLAATDCTAANAAAGDDSSGDAGPVTPPTAPATPAGFTAALGSDGASATLTWDASDGADDYLVYSGATADDVANLGSQPTQTADTSYTAALAPGSTACYTVVAENGVGTANPETPACVTANIPAAPTGFSMFESDGGMDLYWTNPTPIAAEPFTGVRLYRTVSGTTTKVYDGSANNFEDDDFYSIDTHLKVCYRLTSYGPNGESAPAPDQCQVGMPLTPTIAPTATLNADGHAITVTWSAEPSNDDTPIANYYIWRATCGDNHFSYVGGGATAGSVVDTKATAGVSYDYVVQSINASGGSAMSPASACVTPTS